MRALSLLVVVLFLAALAGGWQQVRCTADSVGSTVGSTAKTVGKVVTRGWSSARSALTPRCDPQPPGCEQVCEIGPVYSNLCGGDNGVGRTQTGAFAIPE